MNETLSTNLLEHSGNQSVDLFFSVTPVSTLHERMSLVIETTLGGVQLEGPHEVVGLLEVRTNSVELVDQVFNADDAELSKSLFNNQVAGEGNSLLVDLTVTSLVDHLGDGILGGESESDVRFDLLDHVEGSSVDSDEDGVV